MIDEGNASARALGVHVSEDTPRSCRLVVRRGPVFDFDFDETTDACEILGVDWEHLTTPSFEENFGDKVTVQMLAFLSHVYGVPFNTFVRTWNLTRAKLQVLGDFCPQSFERQWGAELDAVKSVRTLFEREKLQAPFQGGGPRKGGPGRTGSGERPPTESAPGKEGPRAPPPRVSSAGASQVAFLGRLDANSPEEDSAGQLADAALGGALQPLLSLESTLRL